MSNQTNKNTTNNRGENKTIKLLYSIWLGRESLKITVFNQGSDLEKDIEEIKLVLKDTDSHKEVAL